MEPLDYLHNYFNIYLIPDNCGDHVVVINSREVALPGDEWYRRAYFHHRTYAGSKTWTLAWELHAADDTLVIDSTFPFHC